MGKIKMCSNILVSYRIKEFRCFVGQEMGAVLGSYVTCLPPAAADSYSCIGCLVLASIVGRSSGAVVCPCAAVGWSYGELGVVFLGHVQPVPGPKGEFMAIDYVIVVAVGVDYFSPSQ